MNTTRMMTKQWDGNMGAVSNVVKGVLGGVGTALLSGGQSSPSMINLPKFQPFAPTSETAIRSAIVDSQSKQRRRAGLSTQTVYTDPLGLTGTGDTAKPSLLGG